MLQVSLPTDGPKWGSGFWQLNTLLLEADAFKAAFTSFYPSVRALRPMYASVVEWWEAAKGSFATFCRRFAVTARRRDRAGVARWMASLFYLHGHLNRGEHVDWALYEGAKERFQGLLEARAKIFLERALHRCYYFTRFYLAAFFRHLVALSHVVPRSETPSPGYRVVIRFLRQCPSPITREEATDHRALYARLASRQVVTLSGVPAGVVWSRVSGGGAPGAVRDLQWRCALGRLPVRRVGPGHVLSWDGVVYCRGLGFLPSVTSVT
ncbi:hypothetical protein AAFF_G00061860 [Aldrovandia affinis]|uniref:Uncharacterized protein n=1 Tax=Aldrovandia affinis TaxID=143900 RepID=A0AAD7WE54_9TELE|nr:hypothetical protein AAFF_G00061860 [Aldrovandia affinis]